MITGANDGEIRTWTDISGSGKKEKPKLLHTVRGHKKTVTSLQVTDYEREKKEEVISASMDGSCIIWALHCLLYTSDAADE